ncbi:MAG: Hsp20/alpha crystallin family protein [Verrucomicrobia bacterium]|nr:Hsp20/alpha crystallin family protein [Verrucomicrobiota bacterium]
MNSGTLLALLLVAGLAASAAAQVTSSPTSTPTPSATSSASATVSTSPDPNASPSPGAWDPFAEMQRMQSEMNNFFSRAMSEFGTNQNFLSMRNEPGFSSTLDVRDKGDHYEVHAFLPGSESNNVKVTAESNNRLRIRATQSKQEKNTSAARQSMVSEFGEYEQDVTLPGPANTRQMKIEHHDHEVVVSIPKKTT